MVRHAGGLQQVGHARMARHKGHARGDQLRPAPALHFQGLWVDKSAGGTYTAAVAVVLGYVEALTLLSLVPLTSIVQSGHEAQSRGQDHLLCRSLE